MERDVGGGIGMGNTCKSMAHSFQCMTKPTTIKKKKKKERKKKNVLSTNYFLNLSPGLFIYKTKIIILFHKIVGGLS